MAEVIVKFKDITCSLRDDYFGGVHILLITQ